MEKDFCDGCPLLELHSYCAASLHPLMTRHTLSRLGELVARIDGDWQSRHGLRKSGSDETCTICASVFLDNDDIRGYMIKIRRFSEEILESLPVTNLQIVGREEIRFSEFRSLINNIMNFIQSLDKKIR